MSQKPPTGSRVNASHPLANGLVSHWLLGEGGGSKAFNSVRLSDSDAGTIASGVTWGPGPFGGKAATINATADGVSIPQLPGYSAARGISVSFWAKFTPAATVFRPIQQKDGDWILRFDDFNATQCNLQIIPTFAEAGVISQGVWAHCVFVADGTNFILYVNGEFVTSAANAWAPTGTNGISIGGSVNPLDGSIENVAIYARPITASEVRMLYGDPFGFLIAPAADDGKAPAAGGTAFTASLAEGLTLTDGFAASAAFMAALSEGMNLSDALAAAAAFNAAWGEGVTFTDSASGSAGLQAALSETVTLTDGWSSAAGFKAALSEGLTLTDTLAAQAAFAAALSEGVTFVDTLAAQAAFTAALSEGMTLTDSETTGGAGLAGVTEAVTFTDAYTAAAAFRAAVAETMTFGDAWAGTLPGNFLTSQELELWIGEAGDTVVELAGEGETVCELFGAGETDCEVVA